MLQKDKPQQSQAELAGGALYLPAKLPPAGRPGLRRAEQNKNKQQQQFCENNNLKAKAHPRQRVFADTG